MTILVGDMNFQRFPPRDVMLRELRLVSTDMIAMIAVIAEKNSSAIVAIYGFHVIAAIATIAEKVNEVRGDLYLTHCSRHLSIQHGGCESSIPA